MGKMYSAAQEEAIAGRLKALDAKVAQERRRKRTLMHIKDLLSKRVPQVEAASSLLEEVLASLQQKVPSGSSSSSSGGGAGAADSFKSFFDHAERLQALCDRLSAASPAAAQAIAEAIGAQEEDGVEGAGARAGAGAQAGGGARKAKGAWGGGGEEEEEEEDVLATFNADKKK
jgi:hypothetical protein